MLEITLHNGPARLGKWNNLITPTMLDSEEVAVVDDQAMPYEVPRALAEWSVEETILQAQDGDRNNMAVIHGAKYLIFVWSVPWNWKSWGIRISWWPTWINS